MSTCNCNQGFHGDGSECQDIDECNLYMYTCYLNRDCVNLYGSYKCKCKESYTEVGIGEPKSCERVFQNKFNDTTVWNTTVEYFLGQSKYNMQYEFYWAHKSCGTGGGSIVSFETESEWHFVIEKLLEEVTDELSIDVK